MSLIAAILVSPLRAIRSAEARPSQRTLVLCVSLTPDVAESTLDVLRKLEGVGANADCEVAALIDAGGAVYAGINAELPRVADRMALRLAGGRWRRDPRFPEGLGGIGEPGVVAGYLARVSTSHDSVILALKGHGERNRGVLAAGTDEWITPRRLRDEIRDSNVHVDGLLLDCCFGAGMETLATLCTACGVLVASVNMARVSDVDYRALLADLSMLRGADPKRLGDSIVLNCSTTRDGAEIGGWVGFNCAAVPRLLSELEGLESAFRREFDEKSGRSTTSAILRARCRSIGYSPPSAAPPRCECPTGAGCAHAATPSHACAPLGQVSDHGLLCPDLWQFAWALHDDATVTDSIRTAAVTVAGAARQAVCSVRLGADLTGASGLPFWLSTNALTMNRKVREGLDSQFVLESRSCSRWSRFAADFHQSVECNDWSVIQLARPTVLGQNEAQQRGAILVSHERPIELTTEVPRARQQVTDTFFYIAADDYQVALLPLDRTADSTVRFTWSGDWLFLVGDSGKPIPATVHWARRLAHDRSTLAADAYFSEYKGCSFMMTILLRESTSGWSVLGSSGARLSNHGWSPLTGRESLTLRPYSETLRRIAPHDSEVELIDPSATRDAHWGSQVADVVRAPFKFTVHSIGRIASLAAMRWTVGFVFSFADGSSMTTPPVEVKLGGLTR